MMNIKFDMHEVTDDVMAINMYVTGTEAELGSMANNAVLDRLVYMSLTGNVIPNVDDIINDDKLKSHDG